MMPSAKIEKRDSAPPENMLNMPRMPPCWPTEQLVEHRRVDARHRDVRADAVDDQRAEQEQQAALQVAVLVAALQGRICSCQWTVLVCVDALRRFKRRCRRRLRSPPCAPLRRRRRRCSFTALSSLPVMMTFAASPSTARAPAAFSARGRCPSTGSFASSDRRTSAMSFCVRETKPRFGRRRCSGIWPPSKPTLWKPPERDFWPLWPRPAVLPRPEPMPRPTRRRALLAARGRLDRVETHRVLRNFTRPLP